MDTGSEKKSSFAPIVDALCDEKKQVDMETAMSLDLKGTDGDNDLNNEEDLLHDSQFFNADCQDVDDELEKELLGEFDDAEINEEPQLTTTENYNKDTDDFISLGLPAEIPNSENNIENNTEIAPDSNIALLTSIAAKLINDDKTDDNLMNFDVVCERNITESNGQVENHCNGTESEIKLINCFEKTESRNGIDDACFEILKGNLIEPSPQTVGEKLNVTEGNCTEESITSTSEQSKGENQGEPVDLIDFENNFDTGTIREKSCLTEEVTSMEDKIDNFMIISEQLQFKNDEKTDNINDFEPSVNTVAVIEKSNLSENIISREDANNFIVTTCEQPKFENQVRADNLVDSEAVCQDAGLNKNPSVVNTGVLENEVKSNEKLIDFDNESERMLVDEVVCEKMEISSGNSDFMDVDEVLKVPVDTREENEIPEEKICGETINKTNNVNLSTCYKQDELSFPKRNEEIDQNFLSHANSVSQNISNSNVTTQEQSISVKCFANNATLELSSPIPPDLGENTVVINFKEARVRNSISNSLQKEVEDVSVDNVPLVDRSLRKVDDVKDPEVSIIISSDIVDELISSVCRSAKADLDHNSETIDSWSISSRIVDDLISSICDQKKDMKTKVNNPEACLDISKECNKIMKKRQGCKSELAYMDASARTRSMCYKIVLGIMYKAFFQVEKAKHMKRMREKGLVQRTLLNECIIVEEDPYFMQYFKSGINTSVINKIKVVEDLNFRQNELNIAVGSCHPENCCNCINIVNHDGDVIIDELINLHLEDESRNICASLVEEMVKSVVYKALKGSFGRDIKEFTRTKSERWIDEIRAIERIPVERSKRPSFLGYMVSAMVVDMVVRDVCDKKMKERIDLEMFLGDILKDVVYAAVPDDQDDESSDDANNDADDWICNDEDTQDELLSPSAPMIAINNFQFLCNNATTQQEGEAEIINILSSVADQKRLEMIGFKVDSIDEQEEFDIDDILKDFEPAATYYICREILDDIIDNITSGSQKRPLEDADEPIAKYSRQEDSLNDFIGSILEDVLLNVVYDKTDLIYEILNQIVYDAVDIVEASRKPQRRRRRSERNLPFIVEAKSIAPETFQNMKCPVRQSSRIRTKVAPIEFPLPYIKEEPVDIVEYPPPEEEEVDIKPVLPLPEELLAQAAEALKKKRKPAVKRNQSQAKSVSSAKRGKVIKIQVERARVTSPKKKPGPKAKPKPVRSPKAASSQSARSFKSRPPSPVVQAQPSKVKWKMPPAMLRTTRKSAAAVPVPVVHVSRAKRGDMPVIAPVESSPPTGKRTRSLSPLSPMSMKKLRKGLTIKLPNMELNQEESTVKQSRKVLFSPGNPSSAPTARKSTTLPAGRTLPAISPQRPKCVPNILRRSRTPGSPRSMRSAPSVIETPPSLERSGRKRVAAPSASPAPPPAKIKNVAVKSTSASARRPAVAQVARKRTSAAAKPTKHYSPYSSYPQGEDFRWTKRSDSPAERIRYDMPSPSSASSSSGSRWRISNDQWDDEEKIISHNKRLVERVIENRLLAQLSLRPCLVRLERQPYIDHLLPTKAKSADASICELCDPKRLFVSKEGLVAHLKKEHGDTFGGAPEAVSERCPGCDKKYHSQNRLKAHMKACPAAAVLSAKARHFQPGTSYTKPVEEDLKFQCDICGTKFSLWTAFESHKRSHFTENDPLNLDIEDESSSRKFRSELLRRGPGLVMKFRREREEIFPCEVCGQPFSKTSELNMHRLTHVRIKQERLSPEVEIVEEFIVNRPVVSAPTPVPVPVPKLVERTACARKSTTWSRAVNLPKRVKMVARKSTAGVRRLPIVTHNNQIIRVTTNNRRFLGQDRKS